MKITRKSMITGIERTQDLPITEDQVALYESGALIQVAFPNLSASQREFIQTGITEDEWEEFVFHPEDDEDEVNRGYN